MKRESFFLCPPAPHRLFGKVWKSCETRLYTISLYLAPLFGLFCVSLHFNIGNILGYNINIMVGVNKVILIGNLGKNPEIITFPKDGAREDSMSPVVRKATFPLATTEYRKNKDGERIEQTDWHTVVCWRGLADIAEKLLRSFDIGSLPDLFPDKIQILWHA